MNKETNKSNKIEKRVERKVILLYGNGASIYLKGDPRYAKKEFKQDGALPELLEEGWNIEDFFSIPGTPNGLFIQLKRFVVLH